MVISEPDFISIDLKCTSSSYLRVPAEYQADNQVTYTDYEWITYCPEIFSTLRDLWNIAPDDYALSVCCIETLKYVSTPGRSGCLCLPHDERFIIKIMRKSEMKIFLDMLPKYYRYVDKYKNTMLTKFYGLHLVKPSEGQKVRFIVMGNALQTNLPIHKRFDLKGSYQGRNVNKTGVEKGTVLKDHDLDLAFRLDSSLRNEFLAQIKLDCDFLEEEGVMDYSILLGIHICRRVIYDLHPIGQRAGHIASSSMSSGSSSSFRSEPDQDSTSLGDEDQSSHTEPECAPGVRMRAHAVHVQRSEHGRLTPKAKEEAFEVILFCGFMNILQEYNMIKKVEHAFKSLHFDSQSISAVNPRAYSTRFQDFMSMVFPEIETKSSEH